MEQLEVSVLAFAIAVCLRHYQKGFVMKVHHRWTSQRKIEKGLPHILMIS
tara:strand:+ start:2723 stop:2872 length:150 start_codon:yes stop_codon:yes gene_type:complete